MSLAESNPSNRSFNSAPGSFAEESAASGAQVVTGRAAGADLPDSSPSYRIRNTFSGLLVPKVEFEFLDEAYAWIAEQLRPQDFEVVAA